MVTHATELDTLTGHSPLRRDLQPSRQHLGLVLGDCPTLKACIIIISPGVTGISAQQGPCECTKFAGPPNSEP